MGMCQSCTLDLEITYFLLFPGMGPPLTFSETDKKATCMARGPSFHHFRIFPNSLSLPPLILVFFSELLRIFFRTKY